MCVCVCLSLREVERECVCVCKDCPEHYWDYKNHDVKPHRPFQCMIYLGSLKHRQRVQAWSKTTEHKLIDLCKINTHDWPSTDEGRIMDYSVGSDFLFECFDRSASTDETAVDVGMFEGSCNRTWALVMTDNQ